jgi:hypothetical protein
MVTVGSTFSSQPDFRRNVQQYYKVRQMPLCGNNVQPFDHSRVQPPPIALIGNGGVSIPITDYYPLLLATTKDFRTKLLACRKEEEQLC